MPAHSSRRVADRLRPLLFAPTLILALVSAVGAQVAHEVAQRPADAPATDRGELQERTVVTHHSIRIGAQAVPYTAKAGTLLLRNDATGKPIASLFYVYYTRDQVTDLAARPILYSFNGGPGTASVWMHLGFTGPRRVAYDSEGFQLPPPSRVQDNEFAILDVADIVYIDPVGVGYSRMASGEDPHRFHGVLDDIRAMADFIRLFTVREDRWQSPKFIIGESYGTTRAAGLVGYLQSQHQMYFNGVILVSMTTLGVEHGSDAGYAMALPYMSATAWYHKKLAPDLQAKPLLDVLAQSERFASNEYLLALFQGSRLTADQREAVARRIAGLAGVSPEFVLRSNLRIERQRFWKELLRDRGLTVGRLDSRYTSIDRDSSGERPEVDPALLHWDGPFSGAVNTYFRDELSWDTDDKYVIWGEVRPWRQDPDTRVGEMLRRAMTQNAFLEVLVLAGYYDGATDYFTAEQTMSHVDPGGALNPRIAFSFFESGHMMYLKRTALARAKQDLARFITTAAEHAAAETKP